MSIKIKRYWFSYFVIILAILSGPLRLTSHGMTSIYRILAPFAIFVMVGKNPNVYKKELAFISIFFLYSCTVSLIFYKHIAFDQSVFAFYIFCEYVLIKNIKMEAVDFEKSFWLFIDKCTVMTILLAWIQRFTRYILPYMDKPDGNGVNVFFGGVNELGGALTCVFIIYIYAIIFYKRWTYVIPSVCILYFTYINDAKLSIIGASVAVMILLVYKFHIMRYGPKLGYRSFFTCVIVLAVIGVVVLYFINPTMKFRDYHISIRDLVFDAIFSILKGRLQGPELVIGSLHDRTSAIMYGITELKKTFLFGIGFGNSIIMLQKPGYTLPFAKSMHNMIAQLLTEMGYFAFFIYYKMITYISRLFQHIGSSSANLLKATFAVAFVFISSQSSVGILANYYTIMVTIFIFMVRDAAFLEQR